MKIAALVLIIFMAFLANASASGYEYDRMIAGIHAGQFQVGIANFKHISYGDSQGRIILEPLGSIILPVNGEVALTILWLLLILAGVIFYYGRKALKRLKPNKAHAPNPQSLKLLRAGDARRSVTKKGK